MRTGASHGSDVYLQKTDSVTSLYNTCVSSSLAARTQRPNSTKQLHRTIVGGRSHDLPGHPVLLVLDSLNHGPVRLLQRTVNFIARVRSLCRTRTIMFHRLCRHPGLVRHRILVCRRVGFLVVPAFDVCYGLALQLVRAARVPIGLCGIRAWYEYRSKG